MSFIIIGQPGDWVHIPQSFATQFTSIPAVFITAVRGQHTNGIHPAPVPSARDVSTTGFDLAARNCDGDSGRDSDFNWVAMGT